MYVFPNDGGIGLKIFNENRENANAITPKKTAITIRNLKSLKLNAIFLVCKKQNSTRITARGKVYEFSLVIIAISIETRAPAKKKNLLLFTNRPLMYNAIESK